jgi:hypothetical protein
MKIPEDRTVISGGTTCDLQGSERRLQPGQTKYEPFGNQNTNMMQVEGGETIPAQGYTLTTTNGLEKIYPIASTVNPLTPEQRLQTLEDQLKMYAGLVKLSLPDGVADLVAGIFNNLSTEVAGIRHNVINLRNSRVNSPPPNQFFPGSPPIGPGLNPPGWGGIGGIGHNGEGHGVVMQDLSIDKDLSAKLMAAAGAVVKNG